MFDVGLARVCASELPLLPRALATHSFDVSTERMFRHHQRVINSRTSEQNFSEEEKCRGCCS